MQMQLQMQMLGAQGGSGGGMQPGPDHPQHQGLPPGISAVVVDGDMDAGDDARVAAGDSGMFDEADDADEAAAAQQRQQQRLATELDGSSDGGEPHLAPAPTDEGDDHDADAVEGDTCEDGQDARDTTAANVVGIEGAPGLAVDASCAPIVMMDLDDDDEAEE